MSKAWSKATPEQRERHRQSGITAGNKTAIISAAGSGDISTVKRL